MTRVFIACMALFIGLVVSTCNKKSDNTEGAALVDTNLASVAAGFVPNSLSYGATQAGESNPCAGDDLFSCQPVLLRIYISLQKTMLDMVRQIVSQVKTQIDTFGDGSSGANIAIPDGGGVLDFNKTSTNVFSILVKNTSSQPMLHLDVNQNVYTMKADLALLSNGDTSGNLQVSVNFTDANTWTTTTLMAGRTCVSTDVRAPQTIRVTLSKASGLWKGKAQMYNGVWLLGILGNGADATCETVAADSTSMNFYTDFVADNVAAKAKVYMIQRNKSSLSDIENWGMNSLCPNYKSLLPLLPQTCTGFTPQFDPTTYRNPFCNPDTTDVAVWNNSCSSYSTAVDAADFGPATDWIVPSEFYVLSVSVPSSL